MANTPKVLGEYELIRRVSDGAQASVFEARLTKTGETVAVKLFKDTGDDVSSDVRFKREAELLNQLSHRNIVRYRDSFSIASEWGAQQNCLVMEYMEGETLKDRLKKYPSGMPWTEAKDIMEQCLSGLIYACEQNGVVHRDIKPSNIFVLNDGQVRLFDFGIARSMGGATKTGGSAWMGSFDYMSPDFALADTFTHVSDEPFRGDQVSDVFSLVLCFYEMLTGRLPWPKFCERPELEYLTRWRAEQPKGPSRSPIIFRVIRHLTTFIDKGLEVDRSKRFQTFSQVLEAMRELRPRLIKHKGKDEYELIEGLDKGGFGEVYKARRVSDGVVLAIKRLYTDRPARRFTKEAEILRRYTHPHLVQYVDYFQNVSSSGTKQLFLVMEYLEGMPGWSLRNRVRDETGGINPGEALELFRYYLDALQYLHENINQIIHRDIKPGNLYAPKNGTTKAKILDLGVARDVTGTQTQGAPPGTWDYMAPEFVTGNSRGSPQSDIYALGLSLYEALAGKPAFYRTTQSDQEAAAEFIARATGKAKTVIDFSHAVFKDYPDLEKIVRKSTQMDPINRYSSAAGMRADILLVLHAMGRISEFELEEAGTPDRTDGTKESGPASETTVVQAPAAGGQEWQKWVARERGRRQFRRGILSLVAVFAAVMGIWLVLVKTAEYRARQATQPPVTTKPVPEVPAVTPSAVPVVHPMPETPAAADVTASPLETFLADTGTAKEPEPQPVVAEPVTTPVVPEPRPLPVPVEPDIAQGKPTPDSEAQSVRNLVKELKLLRMRGIAVTSFRVFFEDASARSDMAALTVAQQEYDSIRDSAEVSEELKRIWHFIGESAVNQYRATRDGQYLAAARGAFHAATLLRAGGTTRSSDQVIREWNEWSKGVDYSTMLPLPFSGLLYASANSSGSAIHNNYLDSIMRSAPLSRSVSVVLPHQLTAKLTVPAAGGRNREFLMDFVLVPDGQKTEGLVMNQPFYIARTETTFGAMRCYRDAAQLAAKDDKAPGLFSGRIGNEALGESDSPYDTDSTTEAFEFCNWLSVTHGLNPAYGRNETGAGWISIPEADGFRLPTPVEWEYAARFGFDWLKASGVSPWAKTEQDIETSHTSDLVWYYYKNGPRPERVEANRLYPLGMIDMCGNLGELCVKENRVSVKGGSFKDRTAGRVMPSASQEFDPSARTGFRVILPATTSRFLREE